MCMNYIRGTFWCIFRVTIVVSQMPTLPYTPLTFPVKYFTGKVRGVYIVQICTKIYQFFSNFVNTV